MEMRLGDRWFALGVDYEMSGKDLIDSVTQSSKITRAIGGVRRLVFLMSCFWMRGVRKFQNRRQRPVG